MTWWDSASCSLRESPCGESLRAGKSQHDLLWSLRRGKDHRGTHHRRQHLHDTHKLNGTSASTADIRDVVAEVGTFSGMNGILLYLDEIQYFNKKQQQLLLEYMENGQITLIASTTENPYFAVYNALISRSTVFEFKPVPPEELERAVARGFRLMEEQLGTPLHLAEGVCGWIARGCGGDVRKALNTVELIVLSGEQTEDGIAISGELTQELTQRSNMRYDRDNDQHYDLLSALQKSIRGSDENAALHYTARLLAANDLLSVCRRLLVIAAEDVGLAYPQAIAITKACVDSALQLGLPEARIPIAEAVILLATSPKSNSAYEAINKAMADVEEYGAPDFPRHLQNRHFDGADAAVRGQHYRYPHDYPNHYVSSSICRTSCGQGVLHLRGQLAGTGCRRLSKQDSQRGSNVKSNFWKPELAGFCSIWGEAERYSSATSYSPDGGVSAAPDHWQRQWFVPDSGEVRQRPTSPVRMSSRITPYAGLSCHGRQQHRQ